MNLEGIDLGRPARYRLLRRIAIGGMSEIYLATDLQGPRQNWVAVKLIQINSALPEEKVRRAWRAFQRETQVIARLSHPSILSLLASGQQNRKDELLAYMVMPYYPSGSLRAWLGEENPTIVPQEVVHFITQAADALQYAHNRRIIHRDVKPDNFLVRNTSEEDTVPLTGSPGILQLPDLVLADFGIAKLADVATSTSGVIGTMAYMAPERFDNRPVAASDQYALAIMAYELLTGKVPFEGSSIELLQQHATVLPSPPSSVNAALSPAIDQVILRALEKGYRDRFPSIRAFAQALKRAVELPAPRRQRVSLAVQSVTVSVDPIPLPRRRLVLFSRGFSRRGKGLLAWGILLLLVMGVVIVASNNTYSVSLVAPQSSPFNVGDGSGASTPSPTLALTDSLRDNTLGHQWEEVTGSSGGCQFQTGAYHILQMQVGYFTTCTARTTNFSNFTYEAQVTIIQGNTGGIIFRAQKAEGQCYTFQVSRDGTYALILYVDNTREHARILAQTKSTAIHTQLGVSNTLEVTARGNIFALLVNGQSMGTFKDQTSQYAMGRIGVLADAQTSAPAEVILRQVRVWVS